MPANVKCFNNSVPLLEELLRNPGAKKYIYILPPPLDQILHVFFLTTAQTTPPLSLVSDSCFSVSPCWLFVGVWVAPTLSARTFTMPSGQSGRTLWNVPKLSNRFQVLRATGQPPTITPLCVSCVIGLPAQQSKHRHFSSKRERAELTKWMPVFVYCKIFLIIRYLLLLLVHSEPGASSLTGQSHMWLKLRHNLHLSTARVPPCFIPPPPPGSSVKRAPEKQGDGPGRFPSPH